jgi:predicted TIM-barrel fold metal-dependent hydrolase
MIIDVHVHIFPKRIRDNKATYFQNEPAFELLYGSDASLMASADDVISMLDEQGVDKAVVCGFPWANLSTCKMNNDYVLSAVAKYPDRLLGLGCFDPLTSHYEEEVQRCAEAGMAGMGELAFYRSGIDARCRDQLEPAMEICKEKDLPIMIHTNEPVGHKYPGKTPNTLVQIYDLVKQYPENNLILAHWGGGIFFYNLLKKEVKPAMSHVWFDTAASPFLYRPDIYRVAVDLAGVDRILFGTDFCLLKPERYFKEMAQAGLTEEEKAAICGGNAKALFNLEG